MDMNLFFDVETRIKKGNKLFFSQDSVCLQNLIKLLNSQNHRVLVMWALNCAKLTVKCFESKFPQELRPRVCLELCEQWACGKIKMAMAKQAILEAHAVAKELDDTQYGSLCHAIAHAGATVHVGSHALGLPLYELTALVLKHDFKDFQKPVSAKIDDYINRLLYWEKHTDQSGMVWARFLNP